jgi:type IV secretion system protein VirB11
MNAPASFLVTYLRPLAPLLEEDGIVEVAINPDGRVWYERQGAAHMALAEGLHLTSEAARNLAGSVASEVGSAVSDKKPLVSGKIDLAGRALRAQVVATPVVEGGPAITLRAYTKRRIDLGSVGLLFGGLRDLEADRRRAAAEIGEMGAAGDIADAMAACVERRLNVVVSGGTSTGKTTFARGLLDLVHADERIVTIEDAYELFPDQPNAVCLRAERTGTGETTPAKLLEATLRLRPDRIILGELRGGEARTFLDAINTGHGGSFTTIHADTAVRAIDRLALMVMATGTQMTFAEVRRYCATSIDVIVQLGRHEGRRGVAEVHFTDVSGA